MQRLPDRARSSTTRPLRIGLVLATALCSFLVVRGGNDVRGGPGVLLVLAGTAGALWAGRLERRDPVVPGWLIASLITVLTTVALATPSRLSNDLWSYEMYGRILGVHHANPWVVPPAHFASDPFLARVSSGWRMRRSVYGPVFVLFAAFAAAMARSSALAARLWFQGAEAVAVGLTLLFLRRLTRSNAAVLWLGLQPIVWSSAVNGGHNDALVGLALLIGAALAWRRWPVAAGVVIGCAALVKLTALLGIVGVVAWMLGQRDRPGAKRAAITALAVTGIGVVLARGSIGVLLSSNHNVTRASAWNIFNTYFVPGRVRTHGGWQIDVIITAAVLTVVVLTLFVASRLRRSHDPFVPVAATTAAYSVGSSYVLPWYALWSLPSFGVDCTSALATVTAATSGVVLASYELPQSNAHSAWDPLFRGLTTLAAPLPLLAAFVAAALLTARQQAGPRTPKVAAPAG
ncbi:MAG: DUF2029 domain-containing protein [Actinobacteria bacterium]|nr:DUF2029 domain-containing protein [Actinomycetota bacterium]